MTVTDSAVVAAEHGEATERIDIPVSGMTCAACQARVQRTLARQPGVRDAAVNLMTRTATVTFDPGASSPESLVTAIRSTGYGAELPVLDRVPRWTSRKLRTVRTPRSTRSSGAKPE